MKYFFAFLLLNPVLLVGQPDRWQQAVNYKMDIDFDVRTHRFEGEQELTYFNNSPDTLYRVFYHLYFNAFQPGSMMDMRSRTIPDPDGRVGDRISKLKPDEIGYHNILSLKQNGKKVSYKVVETILEVTLAEPIMPGSRTVFDMEFESQVPVQIRRSGRDNKEGIDYSMAQWYPKMCEYDYQGW
ncbi:MAG: M1 family peptidase, partial [Saprospiraceae bacterium]|nr:M1 family peptidase [Saprospiraceae bacterium]